MSVREPVSKVVVLIPTYNERVNLPPIVRRLRAAVPGADVLVLDDGSPDGTGAVADDLAAHDDQVFVMHRLSKQGLGRAYLAGFDWAQQRGYDAMVEMDADGSHQPEQLPDLLAALADADVAIGARWVAGGSVQNWPTHRKVLSISANLYTKAMLGMSVNDATAGYRAYRAQALREMGLEGVESQGYCFQIDLTVRAARKGLRIVEVPITFVEREVGASKMGNEIICEALVNVTKWGLSHRSRQLVGLTRRRRTSVDRPVVADRGADARAES